MPCEVESEDECTGLGEHLSCVVCSHVKLIARKVSESKWRQVERTESEWVVYDSV